MHIRLHVRVFLAEVLMYSCSGKSHVWLQRPSGAINHRQQCWPITKHDRIQCISKSHLLFCLLLACKYKRLKVMGGNIGICMWVQLQLSVFE